MKFLSGTPLPQRGQSIGRPCLPSDAEEAALHRSSIHRQRPEGASTPFDYGAIDAACDGSAATDSSSASSEALYLRAVCEWIVPPLHAKRRGGKAVVSYRRMLVLMWFLKAKGYEHLSLSGLAKTAGVRRATLDRILRDFNRTFGIYARGQHHALHGQERRAGRIRGANLDSPRK